MQKQPPTLKESNLQLQQEIASHKQFERALQAALEREKILGRLRERMLALKNLYELEAEIKSGFLNDLRQIGLPVYSASVQLPASKPAYFTTTSNETENFLVWKEYPIEAYPWVGTAWTSGQAQVLACDESVTSILQANVKTLIEIPLSYGSLGVNSTTADAFDNTETRRVLQSFADLIDLAVGRFLRQQENDLERAEARMHRSVLEMGKEEDFIQVVRAMAEELVRLGLDYQAVGANIFDTHGESFTTYVFFKEGMRPHLNQQNKPVNPELLAHFRRDEVWERARPENFVIKESTAEEYTYAPATLIDVPFAYGSLSIGLNSSIGLHGRLIQLLQTFGELLELGFARAQDMAKRQVAEDALAQRAKELARSNEELEQFAYVASHDLQEPLRMVSSYMELLKLQCEDQLDSEAQEFIHYAVDGAQRMQQLIIDLLQLSRLGNRDTPLAPTNAEAVLALVLTDLKLAIDRSGATIQHAPLPTVLADEQQVGQLFQNLIGNALKFHTDQPPRIHINAERRDSMWVFSVLDNGIGMDPIHTERIFQVFQRLHTRDEYEGTGIGLAICKKIVERHGGRIWVESALGQGTTFYFSLPLNEIETA